jgi:hypothetical protein
MNGVTGKQFSSFNDVTRSCVGRCRCHSRHIRHTWNWWNVGTEGGYDRDMLWTLWTVRIVKRAKRLRIPLVLHPYINRPNNVLCCNPSMPVYLVHLPPDSIPTLVQREHKFVQ